MYPLNHQCNQKHKICIRWLVHQVEGRDRKDGRGRCRDGEKGDGGWRYCIVGNFWGRKFSRIGEKYKLWQFLRRNISQIARLCCAKDKTSKFAINFSLKSLPTILYYLEKGKDGRGRYRGRTKRMKELPYLCKWWETQLSSVSWVAWGCVE